MKALPWLLCALLLGTTAGFAYAYRGEARDREIAEANTRAALDTTRLTLVDSVAARTRLARQARVEADSLGGALAAALAEREATARTLSRTRISFDSIVALGQQAATETVEVEPETGDSVRVATFELEGPPIQGVQTVRAGPQITLDSRLAVSAFTATYAVACAETDAVVTWSTPEWVTATFESGQVDPTICNPLQPGLFRIDAGTGVAFGAGVLTTLLLLIAR